MNLRRKRRRICTRRGESAGSLAKPYGPTHGIGELRPIEVGFLVITPKGVLEDFAPGLPLAEKTDTSLNL